MNRHPLLKRQLERIGLSNGDRPQSQSQWLEFLTRVNNAYEEADDERYMHERAIEISSKELMGLNEELEYAQRIARIGYWFYDTKTQQSIWSRGLFDLFEIDPMHKPISYEALALMVHPRERNLFKKCISHAIKSAVEFECEAKLKRLSGSYCWYKMIGKCSKNNKLSVIIIDIHKYKEAEEEIRELNQQIASSARRAGMAEVATTILHNIGNVLNSANVSLGILKHHLNQDHHLKLMKTLALIQNHEGDVNAFLTHDTKGQLIPKYLLHLSKVMGAALETNTLEIQNLSSALDVIRQIVAMQNAISGVSSMNETVYLPELINSTLKMAISMRDKDHIKIIKSYDEIPLIETDKAKLTQILINLIQNAKESVFENPENRSKEIKIALREIKKDRVCITVQDSGIGIKPEQLQRIFAFGFTTKKNGHGFGLHSSSLSAKEMEGELFAESPGEGLGAKFMLQLPIHPTGKAYGKHK